MMNFVLLTFMITVEEGSKEVEHLDKKIILNKDKSEKNRIGN